MSNHHNKFQIQTSQSSSSPLKALSSLAKYLPYMILLLGLFIRLKIYIQNRSLFIDEANLALNLSEKNYGGFFSSLDYEQFAPPLFMVETKLMVQLFGNQEYALRLIPFVAGLGLLLIFWDLLRSWTEYDSSRIYGLALLSFSILAIRYGTEFKQYSGDAFIAMALIWMASKEKVSDWGLWDFGFWALVGAVVVWYSMPSVFVLAGVGLYFLYTHKTEQRLRFVGCIIIWLFSFAAYYYMNLRQAIESPYLQEYFNKEFLNVFSFSQEVWTNNFDLLSILFRNVTDKSTLSIVFGVLLFVVGIWSLIKTDKPKALLLLVPLMTLVMASSLHLYTFKDRLYLFAIPIIILIMVIGLDRLWRQSNLGLKGLLVLLIGYSATHQEGSQFLSKPMEFEELRPCLSKFRQEPVPGQPIYVHHLAVPSFRYYNSYYQNPIGLESDIQLLSWEDKMTFSSEKVGWIIFAHWPRHQTQSFLKSALAEHSYELYCYGKQAGIYRILPVDSEN